MTEVKFRLGKRGTDSATAYQFEDTADASCFTIDTILGAVCVGTWQGTAIADAYIASAAAWNAKLGATSGSVNELLTDDGAGGVTSNSGLTWDGATSTLVVVATVTSDQLVKLGNYAIGSSEGGPYYSGFFNGGVDDITFNLARAASTHALLGAGVNGDTHRRLLIAADGSLSWGTGATTRDCTLYRSGSTTIRTNSRFLVDGKLGVKETSPVGRLHVQTASTSDIGVVIKATAGQAANLIECRDSSSNVLLAVNEGGDLVMGDTGTLPTPGTNTAAIAGDDDGSGNVCISFVEEGGNVWLFSQQAALTTQLTTLTHTAPGTPDYAIQDLVDSGVGSAFGFATKDEGNTLLSVVANLQARVAELETKLQTIGALA